MNNNIGFTGSRDGMTKEQKQKFTTLVKSLKIKNFHHGDCIGSDEEAHNIINDITKNKKNHIHIVIHPPKYKKYRAYCKGDMSVKPDDYLTRNRDIVNSVEILIATPTGIEKLRSGTWSTIRYAKRNNKIIYIILPSGKIKMENIK